jgi:hypothetical protein
MSRYPVASGFPVATGFPDLPGLSSPRPVCQPCVEQRGRFQCGGHAGGDRCRRPMPMGDGYCAGQPAGAGLVQQPLRAVGSIPWVRRPCSHGEAAELLAARVDEQSSEHRLWPRPGSSQIWFLRESRSRFSNASRQSRIRGSPSNTACPRSSIREAGRWLPAPPGLAQGCCGRPPLWLGASLWRCLGSGAPAAACIALEPHSQPTTLRTVGAGSAPGRLRAGFKRCRQVCGWRCEPKALSPLPVEWGRAGGEPLPRGAQPAAALRRSAVSEPDRSRACSWFAFA